MISPAVGVRDATRDKAQLPFQAKLGYATGVYGIFLGWMMVAIFLLYFYTDVLGLSPAQAGLIFFIASMWDAVSDPLMGWLVERTRSRWGRYRPYLLFGSVPFAATFAALFWTPQLSGAGLFWWALVLHVVFRTCYTVVYLPYTALIARLSTDADERASIAGVKGVFVSLGSLTISFFALPAITLLGGEDEAVGFIRVALICACAAIVALWICFLSTSEKTAAAAGGGRAGAPSAELAMLQLGAGAMLRSVLRNRAFLLVFFGVIVFTGCYTILNKTIVYFFKYDLDDRDAARWALSAIALAGVISPLVWVKVTHWTSKRLVWIAGCLLGAAALLTIYFAAPRDLVSLVMLFFVAGFGIHGFLMTFFAMVADSADYGEWVTGDRVEAPLFGLVSLANKTSLAIGTWALGMMLEAISFEANIDQSAETLEGLRQIMTLVPAAGFIASALVIVFFPFNTADHRRIISELASRKTQGSARSP